MRIGWPTLFLGQSSLEMTTRLMRRTWTTQTMWTSLLTPLLLPLLTPLLLPLLTPLLLPLLTPLLLPPLLPSLCLPLQRVQGPQGVLSTLLDACCRVLTSSSESRAKANREDVVFAT